MLNLLVLCVYEAVTTVNQLSKDLGKAWFKYMLIKGNSHKKFYLAGLKCLVG